MILAISIYIYFHTFPLSYPAKSSNGWSPLDQHHKFIIIIIIIIIILNYYYKNTKPQASPNFGREENINHSKCREGKRMQEQQFCSSDILRPWADLIFSQKEINNVEIVIYYLELCDGSIVFLMPASHERFYTLFVQLWVTGSSTYFDFAFKALVPLLQQLQCVISICNAFLKVIFLTKILCAVFLFFEFVRFGDCPREDLAIFGYRLQKRK